MRIHKLGLVSVVLLVIFIFVANDTLAYCKKDNSMNKSIVKSFFKDFSAGNIDEAFSLVSDNASWWVPGDLPFSGTKTKAQYLHVVGAIKKGFPKGLQLNVVSMIAEGDTVAAEVASEGDHYSGKKYENKYHFLIKIESGKIIDVKEYMDTLHLYQLIQPSK